MSSSYYTFIHDIEQIREFYNQIIAPHVGKTSRSFLLLPIARNKYWSGLSNSQQTVSARTINTENLTFKHFLNLLRRYEVAEGLYTDRSGAAIPSEAFAFYITCDPMDEVKAMFSLVNDWNSQVFSHLQACEKHECQSLDSENPNSDTSLRLRYNGISKYKSIFHKNPIKSFVKLDVDTKNPEHIQMLEEFLEEHEIPVPLRVESHNGYHYLLYKEDQCQALHKFSKAEDWFSIENNALVVIPGTYQGGYPTSIVKGKA